jgi:hypothetical protein
MTGAGHKEVSITTTKDFAGQLVHVTRTVAVGSEEHKKMMQVSRCDALYMRHCVWRTRRCRSRCELNLCAGAEA